MLERALRKLPSHFPAVGVAWGTILKHHRLEKAPQLPVCFATTLATTFDRFGPSRNRLNTGDSFKSKTGVDNKRHTSAHQPLTSHSPMGVSIPPSPPDFLPALELGEFAFRFRRVRPTFRCMTFRTAGEDAADARFRMHLITPAFHRRCLPLAAPHSPHLRFPLWGMNTFPRQSTQ
jgi:hypothetical protein